MTQIKWQKSGRSRISRHLQRAQTHKRFSFKLDFFFFIFRLIKGVANRYYLQKHTRSFNSGDPRRYYFTNTYCNKNKRVHPVHFNCQFKKMQLQNVTNDKQSFNTPRSADFKVVLVIYVFLNGYVTRLHLYNEMYLILDNSSDLGTTSKIRIAISFKIKRVPAGTF